MKVTSPACLTVITKSYLPYARVLMKRLAALEKGVSLYVFLADEVDGYFDPANEPFNVILHHDFVKIDEFRRMSFQYTGFELSNALKGCAHRYLNRRTDHDFWMYFDSDIFPVTSTLEGLAEGTDGFILLSPHVLKAAGTDTINMETNFLLSGIFNGGWLGLKRSSQADAFIDWFVARLTDHSFRGYRHTFVDQLWLNLVPVIFSGVEIVRHRGLNIGYWNLHERPVSERANGTFEVEGDDVIFMHLSGWEARHLTQLSQYQRGVKADPTVQKMINTYHEQLLAEGLPACEGWPYSWANYRDGSRIKLSDRRKYADQFMAGLWTDKESPFDHPSRLVEYPLTMKQRLKFRLARSARVRRLCDDLICLYAAAS